MEIAQIYVWVKWFHIISMVSWFAVLFYLPRLFVYHSENAKNSGFVDVVKVMEKKLYNYIGVPAFWATFISGVLLIILFKKVSGGVSIFATGGWMHAKSLFIIILAVYFFSLGAYMKKLAQNPEYKSGKFFRIYNEVPTILLLLIIAMVTVRPF